MLRREVIDALDPNVGIFNKHIINALNSKFIGVEKTPVSSLQEIACYFGIGKDLLYLWRTQGVPYHRIPEICVKLSVAEEVLVLETYAIKKFINQ